MSFIKTVFMNDIKRAEEANREPKSRVQNIAWPSEAMAQLGMVPVGECKRAMFYKIVGVKPTNPISHVGLGICDAGLMYEDYHINKYKQAGMHVEEQVKIEYQTNTENKVIISGKGDELISDKGKLKLIEMKSISAYKAPTIMGNSRTTPLPASHNLMQAMLYKYYFSNTEQGKQKSVDEVYLQYINRSDGTVFFYKIELTAAGYPVLTAIDSVGREIYVLNLETSESFDDLYRKSGNANTTEGRVAELRISIYDIFQKFDYVYSHARQQMLPGKDFSLIYNEEELELQYKLGRISTTKYNKVKKGGDPLGDYKCKYCPFQKHCLNEAGSTLE